MMNIEFARNQMVQQQARAWEVFDDRVLNVLGDVPRETFVPPVYKALAFADVEIPIGFGEYMMTPTHEGRILQSLALKATDRVLEVGTGSGFLSACLSVLAKSVVSVDIHPEFIDAAAERLAALEITNVELLTMDAMRELPEGQFDAIAVTGSIEHFDPRFVDRLPDGGRLFVVVGDPPAMDACRVTRHSDNDWRRESLFEINLRPLTHGREPEQFQF